MFNTLLSNNCFKWITGYPIIKSLYFNNTHVGEQFYIIEPIIVNSRCGQLTFYWLLFDFNVLNLLRYEIVCRFIELGGKGLVFVLFFCFILILNIISVVMILYPKSFYCNFAIMSCILTIIKHFLSIFSTIKIIM